MEALTSLVTTKTPFGVTYGNPLDQIERALPRKYKGNKQKVSEEFLDASLKVLGGIQEGYEKQVKDGFYPSDLSESEIQAAMERNPKLAYNNTLGVWRQVGGKRILSAVGYRQAGYRQVFDQIAHGFAKISEIGVELNDVTMSNEATILRQGFVTGDTDQAMGDFLSLSKHPRIGLWAGFLDRYMDPHKFSLQGWLVVQDTNASLKYTDWAKNILESTGRVNPLGSPTHYCIVFCDALIQSGYAAKKMWSGNALPSQPNLGVTYGYVVYNFENVSAYKTEKNIYPRLVVITPDEVKDQYPNWHHVVKKARRALLTGHEVGHADHRMPVGAVRRLGRQYQNAREIYADTMSLWAPFTFPAEGIIAADETELVFYYNTAWGLNSIDNHKKTIAETAVDPYLITDPYPYSAALQINRLLKAKAIVQRGDQFIIQDKNLLVTVMSELRSYIQLLTRNASEQEMQDFIIDSARHPEDFFSSAYRLSPVSVPQVGSPSLLR